MKKVFAISLFVFFCAKVEGQVVVNADGTHSIQHGLHIINPNGTISVQYGAHIINSDGSVSIQQGSVIVNANGSHSTAQGFREKDDSKDLRNNSFELLSDQQRDKHQKNQQFYFKGRMVGAAARLERIDAQRKAIKQEKRLKKKRLNDKSN